MTGPTLRRSDFRLLDRLRVRWAEIDAQQIVFNGHYLMYVDTAVAAYWRAMAIEYAPTMAALGGDLYVRKATLEYHGSAHYDELLDVGIRCQRLGNSSMTFAAGVFRGETLLVGGELVYVFADPATQTSRPLPPVLRAALEAFEAGEPMVTVRLGPWAELGTDARALREAVFVREHGIDAPLGEDAADADALHALAVNRFGQSVATGRMVADASGGVQLARFAVQRAVRGGGIGTRVLHALLGAARERGDRVATLQAQASAVSFYRRAGFESVEAPYSEAGLEHQAMRLAL